MTRDCGRGWAWHPAPLLDRIALNDMGCFASSTLLLAVMREAQAEGINFSVMVVDSRPTMSGRKTASALATLGIPCSYVLISALSYIMREVS